MKMIHFYFSGEHGVREDRGEFWLLLQVCGRAREADLCRTQVHRGSRQEGHRVQEESLRRRRQKELRHHQPERSFNFNKISQEFL